MVMRSPQQFRRSGSCKLTSKCLIQGSVVFQRISQGHTSNSICLCYIFGQILTWVFDGYHQAMWSFFQQFVQAKNIRKISVFPLAALETSGSHYTCVSQKMMECSKATALNMPSERNKKQEINGKFLSITSNLNINVHLQSKPKDGPPSYRYACRISCYKEKTASPYAIQRNGAN